METKGEDDARTTSGLDLAYFELGFPRPGGLFVDAKGQAHGGTRWVDLVWHPHVRYSFPVAPPFLFFGTAAVARYAKSNLLCKPCPPPEGTQRASSPGPGFSLWLQRRHRRQGRVESANMV